MLKKRKKNEITPFNSLYNLKSWITLEMCTDLGVYDKLRLFSVPGEGLNSIYHKTPVHSKMYEILIQR